MADHRVRNWHELQRACDRAGDGDTILIHRGHYGNPARLERKRGITLEAADGEWITGGFSPEPRPDAPPKPSATDYAFLGIDDCERITIKGLKIREYWPTILFVKDTKYLAVRNCVLRHGTYAIFAKGKTSHLLIERNEWQQDDSPDHRLWREIDWKRAHGGEGADGRFSYFNGGFLSTKGIHGSVIVIGNRIMDAYNGIRMKAGDKPPEEKDRKTTNADVHIVDNDFIRIRDNPTEPEVFAYDWHIRHNRLLDCHSWFSFDGVEGGYWYYYGNTGRFESRQGHYGEFGHTMGRVLKLSYRTEPPGDGAGARTPQLRWYVFNNSWHLRCPVIGGAREALPASSDEPVEGPDFTANLAFFNNAFAWCDAAQYGPWVCEPIALIHNFDFASSPATTFDHSISDNHGYFKSMHDKSMAQEANGILATRPLFEDACCGDFRPAESSQARGSGDPRAVELPEEGSDAPGRQADGMLNRGAVQDYGLTKVPKLEAAFDRLREAIESALDPRVGGAAGVPAPTRPPKVAGAKGKPAGKR